jgi:hypothetical protein
LVWFDTSDRAAAPNCEELPQNRSKVSVRRGTKRVSDAGHGLSVWLADYNSIDIAKAVDLPHLRVLTTEIRSGLIWHKLDDDHGLSRRTATST